MHFFILHIEYVVIPTLPNLVTVELGFNPYPYGPIANLFPMGGGRHVSPSYDVF